LLFNQISSGSLSLKRQVFTLKILPTVVAILFICLFVSLGFWQIDRASQKRVLVSEFKNRKNLKPFHYPSDELNSQIKNKRFYPIKSIGRFDNAHSMLLDNKIYKHQIGYQIITPFITEKDADVVLVNRGWIPRTRDRKNLPMIKNIVGRQAISGIITLPPSKIFSLGLQQENPGEWPLIIEFMELNKISKTLHQKIAPFIINLLPENKDNPVRDWHPDFMPPERHIAYAFQWFSLAILMIIIYFTMLFKQRNKKQRETS